MHFTMLLGFRHHAISISLLIFFFRTEMSENFLSPLRSVAVSWCIKYEEDPHGEVPAVS